MNKKKILWIIILIIFIVAIISIVSIIKPKDNSSINTVSRGNGNEIAQEQNTEKTNVEYKKIELDDGVLYTSTGKKENADIIVETDYFDTTINDMMLNYNQYKDKTIEIEGLYLEGTTEPPYTFVGRKSTNSLCPYCSGGYSYIEYELLSELNLQLKDGENWIKVIGKLKEDTYEAGEEGKTYTMPFYYIEALNIEIMNERGQDTVNN